VEKNILSDFTGGWFLGNFSPSLLLNNDFEVAIKRFEKGQTEPEHYQLTATEYTAIIMGECRIGEFYLSQGDILTIQPNESADFEALSETILVVIKTPSNPQDKVLGTNVD
jgi:quercetin dioxygenase-like cupin family protein